MSVDRLSVTVPSELGVALRDLAKARQANVSTIVTEAIAREIRLAALDEALVEADRRFGTLPEAVIANAEKSLTAATKRPRPRRKRKSK